MAYTQGRAQGNCLYIACEKLLKAYFSSVTAAAYSINNVATYKKIKLHSRRCYWHSKNPSKLFPLSCCWLATT